MKRLYLLGGLLLLALAYFFFKGLSSRSLEEIRSEKQRVADRDFAEKEAKKPKKSYASTSRLEKYPRDKKFHQGEEVTNFFKEIGILYLKKLYFSDNTKPLEGIGAEGMVDYEYQKDDPKNRSYASNKAMHDANTKRWGGFIASGYSAPFYIQWVHDKVGYGIFADADIAEGSYLMEYTGQVQVLFEGKDLIWSWDYPNNNAHWKDYPHFSFEISGCLCGNEARFINDSPVPARRNVSAEMAFCSEDQSWHNVYITTRKIKKGEQFLISYGEKYWREKERLKT